MDKKNEKLVERFIDGEKQLYSRIKLIDTKDDDSPHANYLEALEADDLHLIMSTKKLVVASMKSSKKEKPKFNKREKK
jgi:hypothetical protein